MQQCASGCAVVQRPVIHLVEGCHLRLVGLRIASELHGPMVKSVKALADIRVTAAQQQGSQEVSGLGASGHARSISVSVRKLNQQRQRV